MLSWLHNKTVLQFLTEKTSISKSMFLDKKYFSINRPIIVLSVFTKKPPNLFRFFSK